MNQKYNFGQNQSFSRFEVQEAPFDLMLKSKSTFLNALKRTQCKIQTQKEPKKQGDNEVKINGFMVSEALLALLICSISGFLVLTSSCALSKAMQMDVQSEMNIDFDLNIEQYDKRTE